jgi:hypothetical protein
MELIQVAGLAIMCLCWTAVMMIGARQKPIAPASVAVPVFDDEDPEPSWLT